MTRIGALIPARLASERLPGKALKEIAGKLVIQHLLDRVFACRFVDPENTVLCTTKDPSDDPLVEAVEAYGASVFRGATDDIIDRFQGAITAFGFDAVVQVNGDNPLTAVEYMDLTMQTLLDDPKLDIVSCKGLPLGSDAKSFTAHAMAHVHAHYRTAENDTGFIYYFTKSGLCEHKELGPASLEHVHDTARLTLDYMEDLEVFRQIFEAFRSRDTVPSFAEVIAYLNANPEVVQQNLHLAAKYWQRTNALVKLDFVDGAGLRHSVNA